MFSFQPDAPELASNVPAIQLIVAAKHPCTSPLCAADLDRLIASNIKITPVSPPSKDIPPYDQLVCTEIDKQKINYVITTLAENGKLALLVKYQKELRRIGGELRHVHPFKFLSTVFSNPSLKKCMKEIHKDYFKWSNFLDDQGNGLTTFAKMGKLSPYINDFAKDLGIKPEKLQGYIQSRDWENMLIFLMNN